MTQDLLPASTAMGAVTLLVSDLDAMTRFYSEVICLDVIDSGLQMVTLGRAGEALIRLDRAPELTHAAHGAAGLFHTAILFETQAALAATLYSVARQAPELFTGSADHLVSQAFYLNDPEGNGIELYWDRDRSAWIWTHGQIEMATLALDPNAFLTEHLGEVTADGTGDSVSALARRAAASVGHVHLAVGDIPSAKAFYVDTLGFETTSLFGTQALFVSAGGYHHHMAMNTWGSRGAGPRTRALGLGEVNIVLPTADDLGALGERMTHFGVSTTNDGRTLESTDPWANAIRVVAAA